MYEGVFGHTCNLYTTLKQHQNQARVVAAVASAAVSLTKASGGSLSAGSSRLLVVIMFHLLISAAGADFETQGKSSITSECIEKTKQQQWL